MTAPATEDGTPVACPDCRAPILWLTTPKGNRMPVDAQPHAEGNVVVEGATCAVLGRNQLPGARAAGRPLHRHHRLSCPHADKWARKERR